MANTTFNGPVRSENGFIGATKNTSTGVFTNVFAINSSGEYTGTKLVGQGTADAIVAALLERLRFNFLSQTIQ